MHQRKGHWPGGKRRNADQGHWSAIVDALSALITKHYLRCVRSGNAVARSLGVSDRSLRRWLAGEDIARPDTQARLLALINEQHLELRLRPIGTIRKHLRVPITASVPARPKK